MVVSGLCVAVLDSNEEHVFLDKLGEHEIRYIIALCDDLKERYKEEIKRLEKKEDDTND